MSTKSKINNYSKVLEMKYGKSGTSEREQFETKAMDFYASQLLLHNRKEAKLTQKELAKRAGIDKSYISRIENGLVQPTFATFMRIINTMGRSIEVV